MIVNRLEVEIRGNGISIMIQFAGVVQNFRGL